MKHFEALGSILHLGDSHGTDIIPALSSQRRELQFRGCPLIASHWSAKLEYLYLDFGRSSSTWTLGALPSITDDARFTVNVVRAGLNYRFN